MVEEWNGMLLDDASKVRFDGLTVGGVCASETLNGRPGPRLQKVEQQVVLVNFCGGPAAY